MQMYATMQMIWIGAWVKHGYLKDPISAVGLVPGILTRQWAIDRFINNFHVDFPRKPYETGELPLPC